MCFPRETTKRRVVWMGDSSDKQYLKLSSLRERRNSSSTFDLILKKSRCFCPSVHGDKTTQHYESDESERMCSCQDAVTDKRK